MRGIVWVTAWCMKLIGLLVPCIFWVGVHSLLLECFFDYFAFNESLCLFEVLHIGNNLGVGGYFIFFEIGVLRPLVCLHPWSSVLLIGSPVESAFASSCEGTLCCIIHEFYL
jgi:hypothetical protein